MTTQDVVFTLHEFNALIFGFAPYCIAFDFKAHADPYSRFTLYALSKLAFCPILFTLLISLLQSHTICVCVSGYFLL